MSEIENRLRDRVNQLEKENLELVAHLKGEGTKGLSFFTYRELEKLVANNMEGMNLFYDENKHLKQRLAQYEEWQPWPPKEDGDYIVHTVIYPNNPKERMDFKGITQVKRLETDIWVISALPGEPIAYCGPFKAPEVKV